MKIVIAHEKDYIIYSIVYKSQKNIKVTVGLLFMISRLLPVIDSVFHWWDKWIRFFADDCTHDSILFFSSVEKHLLNVLIFNHQAKLKKRDSILYTQTGIGAT